MNINKDTNLSEASKTATKPSGFYRKIFTALLTEHKQNTERAGITVRGKSSDTGFFIETYAKNKKELRNVRVFVAQLDFDPKTEKWKISHSNGNFNVYGEVSSEHYRELSGKGLEELLKALDQQVGLKFNSARLINEFNLNTITDSDLGLDPKHWTNFAEEFREFENLF